MSNRIYATAFNLGSANHPIYTCYWDDELESWWDNSGDFDVKVLGWDDREGVITYASPERTDVERVREGADAVLLMLKRWSA